VDLQFLLEQSLLQLRAVVESEGPDAGGHPSAAAVSTYNNLIATFLNTINIYLELTVPSESGIAAKVIKPWTFANKTYTYEIGFKLPEFNWVNCAKSCIVDNMAVDDHEACVSADTDLHIHIGCGDITLQQVNIFVLSITFEQFKELLCHTTPAKLHQLNAFLNKNIKLIEKCIAQINHLIQLFELM